MYKKKNKGWLKYIDFIVLDILSLLIAFVLAYGVRHDVFTLYQNKEYLSLVMVLILIDFCICVAGSPFKNIMQRDFYKEFTAAIKQVFWLVGILLLYLFLTKQGANYSRIFFCVLCPLYLGLSFWGRVLWKRQTKRERVQRDNKSVIIISPAQMLEECIENINLKEYASVGLIATDVPLKGEKICEIPVVANYDELTEYICREWVDEVFVLNESVYGYSADLIENLKQMGVVIHMVLSKSQNVGETKQLVERIGNYTVLTMGLNYATGTQLLWKRLIDIAGGLVGCLITLILLIVVGPVIYIKSPGPIFFSQERVGRNGRKFKMYKFRTMSPDAEERKKELMAENKMGNDLMFKLDYDPRIIGNCKLENGKIKKGIGSFLRETSLDEFPQMLNVLRGDMSLVGTRPPTVDEWEKYELHHRARLAFRPGLTGMWQVSGRSNITDFEEVVKLDTKYISEWSIGLDVEILIKTVVSVFRKSGAV